VKTRIYTVAVLGAVAVLALLSASDPSRWSGWLLGAAVLAALSVGSAWSPATFKRGAPSGFSFGNAEPKDAMMLREAENNGDAPAATEPAERRVTDLKALGKRIGLGD
jgi:hypothetical protein